jgi:hypothetical protein
LALTIRLVHYPAMAETYDLSGGGEICFRDEVAQSDKP